MKTIGQLLTKAYRDATDRVAYLESWSRETPERRERIAPTLHEAVQHEITCAIAIQQFDDEQKERAAARHEQAAQGDLFA